MYGPAACLRVSSMRCIPNSTKVTMPASAQPRRRARVCASVGVAVKYATRPRIRPMTAVAVSAMTHGQGPVP